MGSHACSDDSDNLWEHQVGIDRPVTINQSTRYSVTPMSMGSEDCMQYRTEQCDASPITTNPTRNDIRYSDCVQENFRPPN
jgi:hypothetical protein